jgi:hypothetical protein
MTDLRKAAEMALEFVSWFASDDHSVRPKHKAPEIKEALRQALAQQKKEWVGLTDKEARKFYEKYTNREELIYAIDKFLEEKNHANNT